MPAHHDGASPQRALSVSTIFIAVVAACDALAAQTAHPFGMPTPIPCLTLNAAAAFADFNRDGSLDLIVPGIFFGTLVAALDEDGGCLAANGPGPGITMVSGSPTSPIAIGMAGGDLDQDALEDVVTVTSAGTLHFHRNLGSTLLGRGHFATDVIIDNFLSAYAISPPMVNYSFPVVRIVDFDRDGHQDVLIAGGPIDRWSGSTCPGFLGLYRGDGAGGFQTIRQPLPGNVVDVEVADLDNDGTHDHLVVLMETGSLGAFSYDLLHFAFANGTLVATGTAQNLGPGRLTALAMANVVGDNNLDYIVAMTMVTGSSTLAQVEYFQGNGQGGVMSAWGTIPLPANPHLLGDYIPSLVVGDWNRDGESDLAILRGFVQAPSAYSTTPPTFADSELLIAMGPNLLYAPIEQVQLPGYHTWSSSFSSLFAMLPLFPAPDYLRTIDLRRDATPDLAVIGLRSTTNPSPTMVVSIANSTPCAPGDACFSKVGAASGGEPSHLARLGFEGGPPRPGNPDFACTLLNVQGGCLVGLMWGQVGIANLFSTHGFEVNLAPTEFGYAALASGSLPGQGFHSYPLPIPNQPSLVGEAGFFQYAYYDHVSGTFGGTQATGLRIGL